MAITVSQLHTFLTVVRTGSVTLAADELWVTPPTVSSALAALGKEVGVELFRREGRQLALTGAGEVFAAYAREVTGLLGDGVQAAREASGQVEGRIRIAAVTTAGEYLAPRLISAFTVAGHDIAVELRVANREAVFQLLAAREADLAIAGRPPAGTDYVAAPLIENEIVLITNPGDEFAGRACVDVAELGARTWLLREEGSGTRAIAEEFLARFGLSPRTISLGSNGAIKEAVRLGLGISLQSSVAVAAELEHGELDTIELPEPAAVRQWFVLRSATGALREPVSTFLDFVGRMSLSELPGSGVATRRARALQAR